MSLVLGPHEPVHPDPGCPTVKEVRAYVIAGDKSAEQKGWSTDNKEAKAKLRESGILAPSGGGEASSRNLCLMTVFAGKSIPIADS